MFKVPEEEINDVEGRLDNLETALLEEIERKQNNQGIIDLYLNSLNDARKWYDGLARRLENLDGSGKMDCKQKLNDINTIRRDFEDNCEKIKDKIKDAGVKVNDVISNLDAQQVDDHLKSIQRRENDIKKRIERKMQILDLTNKNLEKIKSEIDQTKHFFNDNLEKLQKPQPLGYASKPIEAHLQGSKNLLKDVENKQLFVETLNKRIANMQAELDNAEQNQLREAMHDLAKKEKQLTAGVKNEISRITQCLNNAKSLENNLDQIRNWINDQKAACENKTLIVSLSPASIEYEVQEFKNCLKNIKDFSDNTISDTMQQIEGIKEECNEEENNELQGILDEFVDDIQKLAASYNQQLENIQKILMKKKEFEQDSESLLSWIREMEAILSSNVKTSSIQILEEQKRKYENYLAEAEAKANTLKSIQDKGNGLMENLSEVDRLNLTCQVKNITDKYNLICLKLKERHSGIVDNIAQLKLAQKQIAEYSAFILSIQKAIKELNKPIGSKIEDVQNLLKEYEKILNKLKDKKAEMSMQKISSLPQLKELLSQHDDIIDSIENQLRRLKQLLLLREQFIGLINDIVNFIAKYSEVVANIEKSDEKIVDKIKKYDNVILKIQECEGLLVSANDKGLQIASEGTVEDRNNIMEQLQTLKHQLQNLKQVVENQKQKLEKTANLYKNFEIDISKTLNLLHEKEAMIKILPILDVDTESVEQELRKHDNLTNDVQRLVVKLESSLDNIEREENIPPSLAETISIGRSLIKSIPKDIDDRKKYLENNKNFRIQHLNHVSEFNECIDNIENQCVNDNDDIDFENIKEIMNQHVSCIDSNLPTVKHLLEKINDNAKNILPSLNNFNKEELLRDIQKYSSTLKDISDRAEKSKENLQKNLDIWNSYCSLYHSINSLLGKVKKDEPITTTDKLREFLQKLGDKINTIQVS